MPTLTGLAFHRILPDGTARCFVQTTTGPGEPPPETGTFVGMRGWTDDGYLASVTGDSTARVPAAAFMTHADGQAVTVINVNVGVRELVTVGASSTSYKAGSIQSLIAPIRTWNTAHPGRKLAVRLRLHVGERAPAEWKTRCGVVYMSDEGFGKAADVPRWWDKSGPYRSLYRQAMTAIAGAVKGIPEVIAVNAPGAAYFYPEPMIMLATSKVSEDAQTNLQILKAAGWTEAQHTDFLKWLPSVSKVWERVVVYLAINPVNLGSKVDVKLMKDVAEAHIAALPAGQAGVENYNIREAFSFGGKPGQRYYDMYQWMATKAGVAWLNAQLSRTPRVALDPVNDQVWDKIAVWLINRGFHSIETSGPARNNSAGVLCVANAWAAGLNDGSGNPLPDAYKDEIPLMVAQTNLFRDNGVPTGGAA